MARTFPILMTLIVFTVASSTPAAVVTLTLRIDSSGPGTFELLAQASQDSGGIASYAVPLTGDVLSVDHLSPNAFGSGPLGNKPVGFGLLRSADSPGVTIFASQDTVSPGYLVYGIGQIAGNITTDAVPVPTATAFEEQPVYAAQVLLATGTWGAVAPAFNLSSVDLGSNVFDDNAGVEVVKATLETITVIPEPAGVTALGLIGFCGMARRRRRLV